MWPYWDGTLLKCPLKALRHEVAVWKDLTHPNILPFLGISRVRGDYPSLISAWMENGMLHSFKNLQVPPTYITIIGCITDYLKDKPTLDRQPFLLGITLGLNYLH